MRSFELATLVAALSTAVSANFYPGCATDCINKDWDIDFKSKCSDANKVSSMTSCVEKSSCSDGDKNSMLQYKPKPFDQC